MTQGSSSSSGSDDQHASAPPAVSFREALRVWIYVGLMSFGGPAGQIAVMHRVLVDEKRWISEHRFLHALNYCMLLPGPEAQQLATYLGWLLHGYGGGLVAGSLFVLPGFLAVLGLSVVYVLFQGVAIVAALFFGLKAAVLAVVVEAVLRIGRRVLKNPAMVVIAAVAFIAIFFFALPFPLLVLSAGLLGFVGGTLRPDVFVVIKPHGAGADDDAAAGPRPLDALLDRSPAHTRASLPRALSVLVVFGGLWLAPVATLHFALGGDDVFSQIATFFSKAAVVTFGGAYAVLAYIAQQAVETYGWLQPGEMLDGLGMAETTPGPLIQVVQFVGFVAAHRNAGALDPLVAGTLGAVLTTWVTFLPCFLWIFLGGPYIERLRGNEKLSAALSAITAAVVGVVLNLAVWFALHVLFADVDEERFALGLRLFSPRLDSLDVAALLLSIGALVAMLRFKVGMVPTLAGCAALGIAYRLLLAG